MKPYEFGHTLHIVPFNKYEVLNKFPKGGSGNKHIDAVCNIVHSRLKKGLDPIKMGEREALRRFSVISQQSQRSKLRELSTGQGSGKLSKSINRRYDFKANTCTVGTNKEYARYIEHGTKSPIVPKHSRAFYPFTWNRNPLKKKSKLYWWSSKVKGQKAKHYIEYSYRDVQKFEGQLCKFIMRKRR